MVKFIIVLVAFGQKVNCPLFPRRVGLSFELRGVTWFWLESKFGGDDNYFQGRRLLVINLLSQEINVAELDTV